MSDNNVAPPQNQKSTIRDNVLQCDNQQQQQHDPLKNEQANIFDDRRISDPISYLRASPNNNINDATSALLQNSASSESSSSRRNVDHVSFSTRVSQRMNSDYRRLDSDDEGMFGHHDKESSTGNEHIKADSQDYEECYVDPTGSVSYNDELNPLQTWVKSSMSGVIDSMAKVVIEGERLPPEERVSYRPQQQPTIGQDIDDENDNKNHDDTVVTAATTTTNGVPRKNSVGGDVARERPKSGEAWPYRETLSFTRSLIFYGAGSITDESVVACARIQEARHLRHKYFGGKGTRLFQNADTLLADVTNSYQNVTYEIGPDGVAKLFHSSYPNQNLVTVPSIHEFAIDYHRLVELSSEGSMRSFCFQRLQMLSTSYKMHTTLNTTIEMQEQAQLLGNDFYRTMKIDNHIHAAAAPSAKQFVQFVATKLQTEPNTVVNDNGNTLQQTFDEAGLDKDHLTIDAFNVLADYSVYQRFDNFNSKYSPFRLADMRRIFLKTTNTIDGRYFAELLKGVLAHHENGAYGNNTACEMRLSIYGMERHEWYDLACWMLHDWQTKDNPGPVVSDSNRWLIQVPRLWRIYSTKPQSKPANGDKPTQKKRSFLEMIENLFVPMFEATLYPDKHPEIAECLKHIVGLDSVDDEGALEDSSCVGKSASEWTQSTNPSYWWQLYFLSANLEVLNRLRKARGLNTFAFRPHAGETGDPMHLAVAYLLCRSINHGILLDAQVSLQYLYYLDQVGLSVSPLSNNFLFRKIAENPFPKFFRRGLNVTLSTDDPLLFHLSDDALLEEYSVTRATFGLSMTDMMEVARNSVRQCGFGEVFKMKWLGENYKRGLTFYDEHLTHVPLIRAKFRAELLAIEHMIVHLVAAGKTDQVLQEMKHQFGLARDAHRDVLFQNFEEVPSFPERGQL